ncbi:MAG: FadR family transcriptional regulator [Synergistales bacterium]|nr:FadR family transcriptional regulator [Synergistales bacterium]
MFKPASRSNLYQEVLKQMIEAIKEGRWKPGERIPTEMELARSFEVGRNSIREATKALAIFGIVESKPGQGTFVSGDARKNIINTELLRYLTDDTSWVELMEVRILLEVQNVYWAAQNATEKDAEELREIIRRTQDASGSGHPRDAEHLKIHTDFHEKIAAIGRNKLALRLLRSIRSEIDAQRHKYLNLTEAEWEQMIIEHEQMVDRIAARDAAGASRIMRDHLLRGLEKAVPEKERKHRDIRETSISRKH